MRFKKGTKVEVLSQKEAATGAWRCAEIISGNGHTYNVKHGWFPMVNKLETVVERVPRKAIRPCPPPVDGVGNWVAGDLVEVFHNLSWRTARVVDVVDEDNYLVRVLGLRNRLRVHKSHLRFRQCWKDGRWFMIGKLVENCDMPMGKIQPDTRVKLQFGDNSFSEEKAFEIEKSHMVSSRTLKRGSPYGSYDLQAYPGAARRKRVLRKDCNNQKICAVYPCSTFGKVDAFVDPYETLDETYAHSSFHFGTCELSRMTPGRLNDSSRVESTVFENIDSCTSSVGSCSAMGSEDYSLHFGLLAQRDKNLEDCYSDDAESSCGINYEGKGCSLSSDEEQRVEMHGSDLHAYYSAVRALYMSGPLSWEDEEKLTNIRQALHISDEEHLMVLRSLKCTSNGILIS